MRKIVKWLFVISVLIGALAILFAPLIAVGQSLDEIVSTPQTTNSVAFDNSRAVNIVNFEWLNQLGRPGLVAVLVFVIGYTIRRVQKLSNFWLYPLIPIGAIIYSVIGERVTEDGLENAFVKGVLGIIISAVTVLVVILAHDKLLTSLARRFPLLAGFVSDDVSKPKTDLPQSPAP